jgi:hypothetical protein
LPLTFVTVQTSLLIPNAPRAGIVTVGAAIAWLDITSASAKMSPPKSFR